MEAVERALERQDRVRRAEAAFRPPIPQSLADIKHLVAELAPDLSTNQSAPEAVVVASFQGHDSDNRVQTFRVSAETKSRSKRDMLLDGFNMMRDRQMAAQQSRSQDTIVVNGRPMRPRTPIATETSLAIDRLISQWLGGHRTGMIIHWLLPDGYRYNYDIYAHKLTRTKINATEG